MLNRTWKRVLLWILATLACFAVASVITACTTQPIAGDNEKAFDVDRADVDVVLGRDGSLRVTERLRYRFDGTFAGAYRDIPLEPTAEVDDVQVSDDRGNTYTRGGSTVLGAFDSPSRFGVERMAEGLRIVWHYRQRGGDRTFILRYRVRGVTRIADGGGDPRQAGVVVPWAPWGDQWKFRLDQLNAQVRADAAPRWVEPLRTDLRAEVTTTRDGATLEASRVPRRTQVALTVAFPREAIESTAGARPGERTLALERERAQQQANEASSTIMALATWVTAMQLPIALLLLAITVAVLVRMLLAAREPDVSVPEYVHGPPDDASPAVGYALAHEGGYTPRLVLATLLDLVDRGLYDAEAAPSGELDLILSVPDRAPDAVAALPVHEQTVVKFFDGLLETPGRLGELKDRVPEHSSTWRSSWESMTTALDAAEVGQIEWDRDLTGHRVLLATATLLAFGVLFAATLYRTGIVTLPLTIGFAAFGLVLIPRAQDLKRRDVTSARRGMEWKAFERWTRDFPRLHDDPPATLALWKRILVFGVAFGTADAVVRSGRIPDAVFNEARGSGNWVAPLAVGSMYGGFGAPEAFASSFAGHVAPQSSSSGGGGFSGGGGGGFSGGGGGGAW